MFDYNRQFYPKCCAAAFRFAHRDPAAVERSQLFGDGEAETEMAFVRPGGVAPIETVKKICALASGGIPQPWSATEMVSSFPFAAGLW